MLSMLCAKSMNLEVSSRNHDAVTTEDISHFLGTCKLKNREYDILMAKYLDSHESRTSLYDDIFIECCDIFFKNHKASELRGEKFFMRMFIYLAFREIFYESCFVCQGRGTISNGDRIEKCMHCDGTGQFIYDDDNRPEFMGIEKERFMKFKKSYMEMLNMIRDIELSALNKIGDE